jgi:hypothetical protein
MLIGITGQKQNGKNTICNFIVSQNQPDSVIIHSFANPIREIGKVFGFSLEEMNVRKEDINLFWNISWRKFAQMIGTNLFRNNYRQDVWIKLAEKRYLDSKCEIILFDDVRFKNEAEFIKNNNGIVIRVVRSSHQVAKSKFAIISWIKSLFLHASERPIDKSLVDYEIVNDGTVEELKVKVLAILETIECNDLASKLDIDELVKLDLREPIDPINNALNNIKDGIQSEQELKK